MLEVLGTLTIIGTTKIATSFGLYGKLIAFDSFLDIDYYYAPNSYFNGEVFGGTIRTPKFSGNPAVIGADTSFWNNTNLIIPYGAMLDVFGSLPENLTVSEGGTLSFISPYFANGTINLVNGTIRLFSAVHLENLVVASEGRLEFQGLGQLFIAKSFDLSCENQCQSFTAYPASFFHIVIEPTAKWVVNTQLLSFHQFSIANYGIVEFRNISQLVSTNTNITNFESANLVLTSVIGAGNLHLGGYDSIVTNFGNITVDVPDSSLMLYFYVDHYGVLQISNESSVFLYGGSYSGNVSIIGEPRVEFHGNHTFFSSAQFFGGYDFIGIGNITIYRNLWNSIEVTGVLNIMSSMSIDHLSVREGTLFIIGGATLNLTGDISLDMTNMESPASTNIFIENGCNFTLLRSSTIYSISIYRITNIEVHNYGTMIYKTSFVSHFKSPIYNHGNISFLSFQEISGSSSPVINYETGVLTMESDVGIGIYFPITNYGKIFFRTGSFAFGSFPSEHYGEIYFEPESIITFVGYTTFMDSSRTHCGTIVLSDTVDIYGSICSTNITINGLVNFYRPMTFNTRLVLNFWYMPTIVTFYAPAVIQELILEKAEVIFYNDSCIYNLIGNGDLNAITLHNSTLNFENSISLNGTWTIGSPDKGTLIVRTAANVLVLSDGELKKYIFIN